MATRLNNPPENRGEGMPRQERRFTQEEMALGNQLIADSELFSGGFIEKFGAAAFGRGYRLYTDVPKNTRMYIQYILKKREEDEQVIEEALGRTDSKEEQWYKEVDLHTLHPDDENLANSIRKSREK